MCVLHVYFSCFPEVLPHIRCWHRPGGLRGKIVSVCEEFDDNEDGILVNVSGSSRAGSPGLSRIKAR